MSPLITQHGRLLVDRIECRWVTEKRRVVHVGRVARAVNCGAVEAKLVELTADEVEGAARRSAGDHHVYEVKPYATLLTETTAAVPLLVYQDAEGKLVLLDGRQRAIKALTLQTGRNAHSTVKTYVISEYDAFRTGRHPTTSEVVKLTGLIKDPVAKASLMEVLASISSEDIFTPVATQIATELRRRAQAGRPLPGADIIDRAIDVVTTEMGEEQPYKLLLATMPRPVVFEGGRYPVESYRRVLPLTATVTRYRAGYERRETRVVDNYRYASLELAYLESIIARRANLPLFEGNSAFAVDIAWVGLKGVDRTEKRRNAFDAYLRAHWSAMKLNGPSSPLGHDPILRPLGEAKLGQYIGFHMTDKNAAQVIRDVGKPGQVEDLKRNLEAEVDRILQHRGEMGLHARRLRAVTQFRLFAKAYVRVSQWQVGNKVLSAMENDRRRDIPPIHSVDTAARWDLDSKPSLVGFVEMMNFSLTCGIVATEVWPIFLEAAPFFECCALFHACHNSERFGAAPVTPTAVEAYLHRLVIRDRGQADGMSQWWTVLQQLCEGIGLMRDVWIAWLVEIDERQGLDSFDGA